MPSRWIPEYLEDELERAKTSITLCTVHQHWKAGEPTDPNDDTSPESPTPKDSKKQEVLTEMHLQRMRQLARLVELRGSLTREHGKCAVTLLAVSLPGAGRTCEAALQESEHLNQSIVPPLGAKARISLVSAVFKKTFNIRNKQIADQLSVDPKEAKLTGWPVANAYRTAAEVALPTPICVGATARPTGAARGWLDFKESLSSDPT